MDTPHLDDLEEFCHRPLPKPIEEGNHPELKRDWIRLLILHPGKHKSRIRCDLLDIPLTNCTDIYQGYTALSYVWGNAKDTTNICVNGCRLAVTVNLAMALDDLRDEKRPLRLWADAICINQKSNEERSSQIGFMKQIYTRAHQAVIYLGATANRTNCLFELIYAREQCSLLMSEISKPYELSPAIKEAALDVLSRPWFNRVWVYQELVLPQKVFVQIGQVRVSWDSLCETLFGRYWSQISDVAPKNFTTEYLGEPVSRFTSQHQVLWDMNQGRLKYHRSLWSGGTPAGLLEVLISRRGSKASDLKDMIFGYGAVTDNSPPEKPRLIHREWPDLCYWNPYYLTWGIDYTQSIAQVYTSAAVHSASIDTPNGIRRLLYHAATKASHIKRDGLPSWVPDWALDINDLQDR